MIGSRSFRGAAAALAFGLAAAGCDSVEERVADHYQSGVELLAENEPVRATLEFRNALQLDENHVPSRFEIARAYEREGEFAAALSNYRLVVELDPQHVEARVKAAQLLLLGNQPEEATRLVDEALNLSPDAPDALAVKAALLLREEKREEAVALARRALAEDPDHVPAKMTLAAERFSGGEPDAALTLLDEALAVAPEERAPNILKLRILEAEGRTEDMRRQLERMIELYPDEKGLRQALVQLNLSQNDTAGAEAALRATAEAFPDDIAAKIDVVRFLRSTEGDEAAREELLSMIEEASDAQRTQLRLALAELERAAGEPERAAQMLAAVLEDADSVADRSLARLQLARQALAEGERVRARTLVDEVLAEDDRNVDALGLRASLRLEDQDLEGAILDLRTATEAAPQDPRLMMLLARAYERNGSPDLAGERLAAATRASDYAPDIVLAYANFLRGQDRGEAAETVLSESARRHPQDEAVLAALAEQRARLGDWARATEAAEALAALTGDPSVVRRVRAAGLAADGRLSDSIEELRALLEETDGQEALSQLVDTYVRADQAEQAETLLDELLAEDPGDIRARLLKAGLMAARGEAAAAEDEMRRAIEKAPDQAAGHLALTRLLSSQGRLDEATEALETGVAQAKDPNALRLSLAQLYEARGDVDAAIEEYGRLFEAAPDSLVVANNYASLLADHRGDDAESLRLAEQIARRLRSSSQPEFQDTYGWVQHRLGDYEAALRSLVPAAEALPDNALVRFHTGMTFSRLGRANEAREHLEAALRLNPDFTFAEEARSTLAELPAPAATGE